MMASLKVKREDNAYRAPVSGADIAKSAMIHVAGLEKRFKTRSGETVNALTNVNLDIRENEFISVVGPSGCGKTTLLRILAGLESASSGVVQCDGAQISEPTSRRGDGVSTGDVAAVEYGARRTCCCRLI